MSRQKHTMSFIWTRCSAALSGEHHRCADQQVFWRALYSPSVGEVHIQMTPCWISHPVTSEDVWRSRRSPPFGSCRIAVGRK